MAHSNEGHQRNRNFVERATKVTITMQSETIVGNEFERKNLRFITSKSIGPLVAFEIFLFLNTGFLTLC